MLRVNGSIQDKFKMNLTFLADQRPFEAAQTISLDKDNEFSLATDMRQVKDQDRNSFLATGNKKLYKFTRTNKKWNDKPL